MVDSRRPRANIRMDDSNEPETVGDSVATCRDYLPLSRYAMELVGAAAQTLGAVYVLASEARGRQIFETVDTIAQSAVLPKRTVQSHVAKLVEAGWLESLGRQLLPGSKHRRRRTVTLKLTRGALDHKEPFGMLPRWAATSLANERGGSWAERAVFACLFSAAKYPESELAEQGCLDGREFCSLTSLRKQTALTWPSIRAARDKLERGGLVKVYEGECGEPVELALNLDCRLLKSDVAKPVKRKSRTRAKRTRSARDAHSSRERHADASTKEPARTPANTCADPLQKAAPPTEKTCAIPLQIPALTPEKTCAPHSKNNGKNLVNENLLKEPAEKNSGQERRGERGDTDHVHFRVDVPRDSVLAEHCFRAMSYNGTDGGIVWKAAAWVNTGAITAAQFADAYNGVKVIEPAKAVAYFRSILKDTLGEARLTDLERRTSLPPGFVQGPQAADEDRQERSAQPEHISSVIVRSMKRATELAQRKGQLDKASKKGKAGAA